MSSRLTIVKMPASVATACTVDLLGRVVRLSVRCEGRDVWRWQMHLEFAHRPEAEGMAATKLAAQVASQLAVEQWLWRTHNQHTTDRYMWTD